MADKAQLKCNQGDIYPLCSLDNMVRSVSSSEAVSIPVLDAAGKITTSYFPDGIGSGAETETDILNLGSSAAVVIEPGKSYIWSVTGAQTISAVGSSGYIGSSAFVQINVSAGTVTGAGDVVVQTPFSASTNNYCTLDYREGAVYLSSFYSWSDVHIIENSSVTLVDTAWTNIIINSSGYLYVSSGGVANNITINRLGRAYVYSNGEVNNIIISSGGHLTLLSGTVSDNITVNSKGVLTLGSNGACTATNIKLLQSNGSALFYLYKNSYFQVKRGATSTVLYPNASNCVIQSDMYCYLNYGTLYAPSLSGGFIYVNANSIVSNFITKAYGTIVVSSGRVTSGVVSANGRLSGAAGAIELGIISSGGTLLQTGGHSWRVSVLSGGLYKLGSGGFTNRAVATSTSIASGGTLIIYSGGTATSLNSATGAIVLLSGGKKT